ncbi:MAG: TonB-dependent receptor [Rhodocyclaceae bacterium]
MKRFDYRTLALFSALLLQISAALAQINEDEEVLALAYGDKATISIATGSRQALRRAPAVASVITAEDIAAMGATDLDEVLETVPGVHVTRAPNGYASAYAIRGIATTYGPQTLMLQNGIPITTLYQSNKGNVWGGFPVEHIARIEVIRGPGSALYGADAFSGVINIITKNAADTPGTEFGARAGSFRTGSAWLQHGGKTGPVEVAAYLRVGSTEGFKETLAADAQTARNSAVSLAPGAVNTGYDAVDANLDLGYGKWRARAGYKLRDNMETGAGIASALDPVGREKSERITADLSWADAQFAQDWGLGFTGSYLYYTQQIPTDFLLFPAGANVGGGVSANGFIAGPETWERQFRLSGFATYTGFAGHSVRFGLGHDDLNLYKTHETRNFTYAANGALVPTAGGAVVDFSESNPFIRPQRRKVDYLLLQDEWHFAKDWALTAGLRRDKFSDFGATTNPRLALVWDASLDLTAKLLMGRAFRAPAFLEVYGISNPVALGNPNLRPEIISTVETAFSWQARRDTQVNLSLFRYEMKDIIRAVTNPVAGTGSTYFNIGAQHGYGAELEAVWDATRSLRVTANYSWQRSIDEATNTDAGTAPHHHVYARADWRFTGNWLASTQINRVAERKRAAGDLRPDVADYTTLDLTLRTTNSKNRWNFAGSVRNLFNTDVREPSLAPGTSIPNDLPMAPRSAYLQAIFRL